MANNLKKGAAEFPKAVKDQLPEAPNYLAGQVVETRLGKKALVITTKNYNYVKQLG